MSNSETVLACPLCLGHFAHFRNTDHTKPVAFGYGLDFRVIPRDCNRSSDIATCPDCHFTARIQDFSKRITGNVKDAVHSQKFMDIFKLHGEHTARSWPALIALLDSRGINPRDLGIMSLKGSWVARELDCLKTEDELLRKADAYLDDALRRGLTKGDPGMVMYLLGEINRRRGEFLRSREMLTFLGNNPRYRYPALLLTVLIEEEDCTPVLDSPFSRHDGTALTTIQRAISSSKKHSAEKDGVFSRRTKRTNGTLRRRRSQNLLTLRISALPAQRRQTHHHLLNNNANSQGKSET